MKVVTGIRMPNEMRKELERVARTNERSVSQEIRLIIRQSLEQRKHATAAA